MIPTSKEEFKAILDRQQQSGLSIRDFCSNEAYTVSSFHYWKSKFGFARSYRTRSSQEVVPPVIAPVSLKSALPGSVSSSQKQDVSPGEISIKFPGGVEVSFSGQQQTEIALQVLNQLYSTYVLAK
jgi:putative transposase